MLVAIADDLHISHNEVSLLPTLSQLGYGSGIVLISPLGDLIRRRQLVLLLLFLTTTLSVGLALAPSIKALEGLSFVVGLLTVNVAGGPFLTALTFARCLHRFASPGQPTLRLCDEPHYLWAHRGACAWPRPWRCDRRLG